MNKPLVRNLTDGDRPPEGDYLYYTQCVSHASRAKPATERGPIADQFLIANLKIRTAAGSGSLKGLDGDEANGLCERIIRLTDLADDA